MNWLSLVLSVLGSGVAGATSVSKAGGNNKTVAIGGGITALAGLLAFLVQHPVAQHPAVQSAILSSVSQKPLNQPQ